MPNNMTPEYAALTRIHAYVLGLSKDEPEDLETDFEILRGAIQMENKPSKPARRWRVSDGI